MRDVTVHRPYARTIVVGLKNAGSSVNLPLRRTDLMRF
jgi:hypothetical protein